LNLGLNQDTSLDLFDIDENDVENEYDYSCEDALERDEDDNYNPLYDPNFPSGDHPNSNTYGYTNYSLPSLPPQYFTSHSQNLFADPFQGQGLSSIAESVEHHFQHATANNNVYLGLGQDMSRAPHQPQIPLLDPSFGLHPAAMRGYVGGPAWVPIPASVPALLPISVNASGNKRESDAAKPQTKREETGCSVCLASHPRTLAVLIPCEHPLCSACLTSALNIVGEKDMECAVCRGKVDDFKLIVSDGSKDNAQPSDSDEGANKGGNTSLSGKSFMEPLFSSPESGICGDGLESAFEFGLGLDEVRASTPKLRVEPNEQANFSKSDEQILQENDRKVRERGRGKGKTEDNVVLRIDNVPWVRLRFFPFLLYK
jgi:Zinc finger, C3HC4 type (RING finger)